MFERVQITARDGCTDKEIVLTAIAGEQHIESGERDEKDGRVFRTGQAFDGRMEEFVSRVDEALAAEFGTGS